MRLYLRGGIALCHNRNWKPECRAPENRDKTDRLANVQRAEISARWLSMQLEVHSEGVTKQMLKIATILRWCCVTTEEVPEGRLHACRDAAVCSYSGPMTPPYNIPKHTVVQPTGNLMLKECIVLQLMCRVSFWEFDVVTVCMRGRPLAACPAARRMRHPCPAGESPGQSRHAF